MNAEKPKSARDVLRALIREIDEEESDAIWAGVERDLVVDYTSGHWLPGPLSREQLGDIRTWLSCANAPSEAVAGFRKTTWSAQKEAGLDFEVPDSLEARLKPPRPGLEEPRFHWLPTLLGGIGDGARSELVLQSRDPARGVPPPFPMVVLDGGVLDLVDDGWEHDQPRGVLRFELEGRVPSEYSLDITRSDEGSMVLMITSVSEKNR